MFKQELVKAIQQKTNIPLDAVETVINTFADTVVEKVAEGEMVGIKNFGTFFTTKRAERSGRNPNTGAPIIIEACKVVRFKAGKAFKAAVNK